MWKQVKIMLKKNNFAICVPLTGSDQETLFEEIDAAMAGKPDFLEWRRDYYTENDTEKEQAVLEKLKACEAEVIYTFRATAEGGMGAGDDEERLKAIRRCVQMKSVDYVDIELDSEAEFFENVITAVKKADCGLLLSHHHFEGAYTMEETVEILRRMEVAGADVLKLAVTPPDKEALRQEIIAVQNYGLASMKPVVLIAMGELGRVTRIVPELLGGSLTYAAGQTGAAPGQMSIEAIRKARQDLGVGE